MGANLYIEFEEFHVPCTQKASYKFVYFSNEINDFIPT